MKNNYQPIERGDTVKKKSLRRRPAVGSNQAVRVYVHVCARMAVWGGCLSVTVHAVSVCLCLYVCPFLHECFYVFASLFVDQFCFCPPHRDSSSWRKCDLAPPLSLSPVQ